MHPRTCHLHQKIRKPIWLNDRGNGAVRRCPLRLHQFPPELPLGHDKTFCRHVTFQGPQVWGPLWSFPQSPMVVSPAIYSSPAHNTRSATKLRANAWRNPSILGGEPQGPWWEEGGSVVSLRLYFDYTERIRGEGDG